MPILVSSVPSLISSAPDLQAIITSLAVFSLAVAAVIGGIYKGLKDVKFGKSDSTLPDTMDAKISNKLIDILVLLVDVCDKMERHLDKHYEKGHDLNDRLRASTEEMHRLRVAVVDLHEHMRRGLG